MKSLLFSLRFLTRLPIPGSHRAPASRRAGSLLWYPVVGGVLGVVVGWLARDVLPLIWPASTSRLLALAGLIAVKDAFHLDGLADLVDGLHGGSTPGQSHRIMKDPSAGAMGVVAIAVGLGIEAAVVLSLPATHLPAALGVSVCVGTTASVGVLSWCPPLSDEGLAASLAAPSGFGRGAAAFAIAGLLAGLLASAVGLLVGAAGGIGTGVYCLWLRRRLGGASGDTCGAAIIGVQVLSLLCFQALLNTPLAAGSVGGWIG